MRRFGYDDTWSVVNRSEVQPVWTIPEDESLEDIHTGQEFVGRYTFDMKGGFQSRNALIHARNQMLKEAKRMNCNVLIREGWSLTALQRGQDCRIEIVYQGRPARSHILQGAREPPFLSYLPSK